MLDIDIPGWRHLHLDALVLDLNGTLTRDGVLLPGVEERLATLGRSLQVQLLSADTFGSLESVAARLGVRAQRLTADAAQAPQKAAVVRKLADERVVAIRNGANDAAMLREAALGIIVLGPEGLATAALHEPDVMAASIQDALDLLLSPKRLVAT